MAFVVSTLQNDIKSVFDSMTDGDEHTFSDGISNAIVTFVGTGQVSTTDSGSVSSPVAGTYTGSGTGNLSVTATNCAKIIYDACQYMYEQKDNTSFDGDDYLAEKLGEGIQKMADEGVVHTTVTGQLVTTSSPPSTIAPYGGQAEGTITCNSSSLINALKILFKQMYQKRENAGYDGNLEFAKELAKEINAFWTSGSIKTNGKSPIVGSVGTGTIS